MKKVAIILLAILLCCAVLSLTACGEKKLKSGQIRITIGEKSFIAELVDTKAAKELEKSLPLKNIKMHFLNNKELYYDIPGKTFVQQTENDATFGGDIVLFGDNRLAMFYDFANTDTWTRIGKIRDDDKTAFINAVMQAVQAAKDAGRDTITVTISK